MPNRIIKESILTSDTLAQLSWFEQNVFFRLIVLCDDYGRTDARAAVIRGSAFALYSGVTEKQVQDAIIKLSTVGIADLYEVGGRPYLQLCAWAKHQTIRAKRSKYPEPLTKTSDLQADENICKQMQADESICLRNPIQSESNPIQSEKESESKFSRFWDEYPKKKARADAQKAWNSKAVEGDKHIDAVLSALKEQKQSADWQKEDGKFIPYPATWLRGKRWEDTEPESEVILHEAPPEWAYDPNKSFEEQLGVKF